MGNRHGRGAISKYDFVARYVPSPSKNSVCYWFRRHVHTNPELMRRLAQLGYRKHDRSLSARMAELIELRGGSGEADVYRYAFGGGSVRLLPEPDGGACAASPRPVFREELELLGVEDSGYSIAPDAGGHPYMWAVGNRYYHAGGLCFTRRYGSLLHDPELTRRGAGGLLPLPRLHPVAVAPPALDGRTVGLLADLEAGAVEAVGRIHAQYGGRMPTVVAFSGGKDSVALLGIVAKALPHRAFEVVWADTGMEFPSTPAVWDWAKGAYPGVAFTRVGCDQPAISLWYDRGAPNIYRRWCCPTLKSEPMNGYIRGTYGTRDILLFEGVRRRESPRRMRYGMVAESVRGDRIIHARPLLEWSTTEVWLYILLRGLKINDAYRYGKARVGCLVCPFGGRMDDYLARRIAPAESQPFFDYLMGYFARLGEEGKVDCPQAYVDERRWRLRATYQRMERPLGEDSNCNLIR